MSATVAAATTLVAPTLPAADPISSAGNTQLILALLVGIAVIVGLITVLKMHPFLALILGSGVLGLAAGLGATPTVDSFTKGSGRPSAASAC